MTVCTTSHLKVQAELMRVQCEWYVELHAETQSKDGSTVIASDENGTIYFFQRFQGNFQRWGLPLETGLYGIVSLALDRDRLAVFDQYQGLQIFRQFGKWHREDIRPFQPLFSIQKMSWITDDCLKCVDQMNRAFTVKRQHTFWRKRPYWIWTN